MAVSLQESIYGFRLSKGEKFAASIEQQGRPNSRIRRVDAVESHGEKEKERIKLVIAGALECRQITASLMNDMPKATPARRKLISVWRPFRDSCSHEKPKLKWNFETIFGLIIFWDFRLLLRRPAVSSSSSSSISRQNSINGNQAASPVQEPCSYGTSLSRSGRCGEHQLYWDYSEPQRVISAMVDAGTLPGFRGDAQTEIR